MGAHVIASAVMGMAVLLAGAGPLWAREQATPEPAGVVARIAAGGARRAVAQQGRRPFEHVIHGELSCRECHATGVLHRSAKRVWTPLDCASCHHDPARNIECDACHEAAEVAVPRRPAATMALSVWDGPRTRELPFDHTRHDAPCTECHQTAPALAPRECSTCHAEHTQARVECATCHVPPAPAVHDLTAHLTCTGARCHTGAATERPMLARPSCLVCHDAQRDHRPGKECVRCHFIPRSRLGEAGAAPSGAGARAPAIGFAATVQMLAHMSGRSDPPAGVR